MINIHLRSLLVLLALASVSLVGCSQENPYPNDPEGVDRSAKPQMIVKGKVAYLDQFRLERNVTKTKDILAYAGQPVGGVDTEDTFFQNTGIRFIERLPEKSSSTAFPETLSDFGIWLGQKESSAYRSCTEEERVEDIARLDQNRDEARLRGVPDEDIEKWQREFRRNCKKNKLSPEHPFRGYLEVDGMPLGPKMTFAEVQARRKALGLLPLELHPLDTLGRHYRAYVSKSDGVGDWSQTWVFEWQADKRPENRVLVAIQIP